MWNNYLKEGLDLKKLCLILIRKTWILAIATVIGILLGGMIYMIIYHTVNKETLYQAETEYHISFDINEFADVVDYYNAYTWGTILIMDPIVEVALEQLPESITRDMVVDAVSSEMIGDYRFLTIRFTTTNAEISDMIAEAYILAMESFAETIGGLETIEAWRSEQAVVLEVENYVRNACLLGAVLGFLIALFILLFIYIVDDGIMVPRDIYQTLNLSVIGIRTKKKNAYYEKEEKENIKYLEVQKVIDISEELDFDYENLRKVGKIALAVPAGKVSMRKLERIIENLQVQECIIEGIILVEVDDIFIKQYLGIGHPLL